MSHLSFFFFFNDTATTEIYTLSLHDALPIYDILDVVADSATLGKTAGKDAANDKPTYVSLLGLDQARAHADELCALAHAALARSGLPDTRALAALADMVVSRTH